LTEPGALVEKTTHARNAACEIPITLDTCFAAQMSYSEVVERWENCKGAPLPIDAEQTIEEAGDDGTPTLGKSLRTILAPR